MSGPPEAQRIHTLSKFRCLLHELYLTNYHSSEEHAIYVIYVMSCLLLAVRNLTTCHLSNLDLSFLIFFHSLLSSFVGVCLQATMVFPQYNYSLIRVTCQTETFLSRILLVVFWLCVNLSSF